MSTQVGQSNTQKTAEICSTCPTANLPKNLHFDSSQNHHTKQESVKKDVVSTFPQTPGFAAHGHGISKVNNSNRKPTQEGQKFIPAVKASAFVKALSRDTQYAARYDKVVGDAMALSKTELQARYVSEYNSLRDRIQQAKERHITFAESLRDIRDWLIHLGPKPAEGYTVDRIKSAKGYVKNNIRWATKYTQTINRGVTKWHKMPDGPDLTTQQLANKLGLSYDTLHKRFARGWTVARLLGCSPRKIEDWQFPTDLSDYCESLYHQRSTYKTNRLDWFITHFDHLFHNELREQSGLESHAVKNAGAYLARAKNDRLNIIQSMKAYEERKLNEISAILGGTVPANDTSPAKPLPVAAQARHQPLPRPLPVEKEVPYRPSASEIAETMEKLRELATTAR